MCLKWIADPTTISLSNDLAFLQGAANILGMAIERERYERSLKAAVERHEVLLKEINHRVKNSLSLVISMLRLQAREDDDPKVAERLEVASARVKAVARAHEWLYQRDDVRTLDLGVYVEQVCKDLDEAVSNWMFRSTPSAGSSSPRIARSHRR